MGRCDQGIKFCSNFKVLGMQQKQCHCVRLIFLIPAVYLLCQMDSIWRRYRDLFVKPNRQKKIDADCTSPYSPYGDVEGPYKPYRGDVVDVGWLTVVESRADTCLFGDKWYEDTCPNLWAPRVTHYLVYVVM
jgi:hypothetical protein